jgi:hypothetical protein
MEWDCDVIFTAKCMQEYSRKLQTITNSSDGLGAIKTEQLFLHVIFGQMNKNLQNIKHGFFSKHPQIGHVQGFSPKRA